jgi:hypothetical protein
MPTTSGDLLVSFAREGQPEHFQIYQDDDKALKGALILLLMIEPNRRATSPRGKACP